MVYDTLFSLANMLVLPAWLVLLVYPRKKAMYTFIYSLLIPAILALAYAVLLLIAISEGAFSNGGGFGSLPAVRQFLGSGDAALLLAWVHFLCFDLFVAGWIVQDAHSNRISHWLVAPQLLGSLMAGPAGLLTYLCLRLYCVGWKRVEIYPVDVILPMEQDKAVDESESEGLVATD